MIELNIDGLVGPSHHFGGLSRGNLASISNAQRVAKPKLAALQGLEKMRWMVERGYHQGFIPPQFRPNFGFFKQLGFRGSITECIEHAAKFSPKLLSIAYSASSMWAANAATVTPSSDSDDGRVHFTVANLLSNSHRALEASETEHLLRILFPASEKFAIHPALPSLPILADEGAANHSRLCRSYGERGRALFVYGRHYDSRASQLLYPARQTREASAVVAQQHGLTDPIFLQQSPVAINAGAFHNDVVAVANCGVLLFHEYAFESNSQCEAFARLREFSYFTPIEVSAAAMSLEQAIQSYFFNSQLLAEPDGDPTNMYLLCPIECREDIKVRTAIEQIICRDDNPITNVDYIDVRESMGNGGGPACLRLRVVLTSAELAAVNSAFLLTVEKIEALQNWVNMYYRETLSVDDLASPTFADECRAAAEALEVMMGTSIYSW
jgi:succinylarginine dihydrolase